jgi:hypothetical protein
MSGREVHTKFWEENLKEKRPLGRPVPRWAGNIKMYLEEIGWEDIDWIYVANDRDQWCVLVKTAMNI